MKKQPAILSLTIDYPRVALTTQQFFVQGMASAPVTVQQNEQILKTITPDANGQFQFCGNLLEDKERILLFSDGKNQKHCVIHSLVSLQKKETLNYYAYGINDRLTYYFLDKKGNGGLVQLSIVQATTNPADFQNELENAAIDFDPKHFIGITIQYRNLGVEEPFSINGQFFYGYLDAYFDDHPCSKIGESSSPKINKGETAEINIFFQTDYPTDELNAFDVDFIPNHEHPIFFHLVLAH